MLVTEFTVAAPAEGPYGVALGSGGKEEVWTTLVHAGQVARVAGQVGRIDADDGGRWVTLWATGLAVRLDASGSVVDQVAFGKGTEPHGLTVTPDGNLWVALETGALAYVHS